MRTVTPEDTAFSMVVEYPYNTSAAVLSNGINLWLVRGDTTTQITTCGALTLHAGDHGLVWAEAELMADHDGNPIFEGSPCYNGAQIITKVFDCHVVEVRSASSYTRGYRDAYEHLHQKPPRKVMRDLLNKVAEKVAV